jgi:predicted 3-demethylubiquinone-9 3-methyltransferase (glyoxalase superfamily)
MKIHPHLWFESQAEEAMAFYTSIFKDSKILGRIDLPDPTRPTTRLFPSRWRLTTRRKPTITGMP